MPVIAFPCTIGVSYTSQVFPYLQNRKPSLSFLLRLSRYYFLNHYIMLLAAKAASPLAVLGNLSGSLFHVFPPSLVTMIERKSAMDRPLLFLPCYSKISCCHKKLLLFSWYVNLGFKFFLDTWYSKAGLATLKKHLLPFVQYF
jgi:hypothetical protein